MYVVLVLFFRRKRSKREGNPNQEMESGCEPKRKERQARVLARLTKVMSGYYAVKAKACGDQGATLSAKILE